MIKRTFKYCATHKDDEKYMQEMCSKGWCAIKLVEGFWTFEQCEPNQYFYRICYLRGKSKDEVENIKKQYALKGIEYVSRYSFWAIFRSTSEFRLYNDEEDKKICQKIYAPMPIGAMISIILFVLGLIISFKFSWYFLILTILIGIYAFMCIWLAFSYHKLLKEYD